MPPAGGSKRKRGERTVPGDDGARASPHRPNELNLARQAQSRSPTQPQQESPRSNRRQSSRGGRDAAFDTQSQASVNVAPADAPMADGQPEEVENGSSKPGEMYEAYIYQHITDRIVQNWSNEGREKIKVNLVDLCQTEGDIMLDIVIQELVQSATNGRIDASDAGLVLKEAMLSTKDDTDAYSLNTIQDALLGAVSILFTEDDPRLKEETNAYVADLAILLAAAEIDPDAMRLDLDAKLIEQLGLIRNSFHRQVIRKQTNALYRQSNYNLLREESEGFSKLVTELFTTSGNDVPYGDVVDATVEKVKAMIGAFDLDVGRSLDVVLDVFGSVLVKQYRFFVKFLRASPWWPRGDAPAAGSNPFQKLSGLPLWALPGARDWHLSEDQKSEVDLLTMERDAAFWNRARTDGLRAYFTLGHNCTLSDSDTEKSADAADTESKKQWMAETGVQPRHGSSEAAQLLGFKLKFYAPGAEGDSTDGTPRNLIYLAALLIKIGFISLHDLYPHLWRQDSEMEDLKKQKEKEKIDREEAARPGAGASNALATAGALADDTVPVSRTLKDQTTRSSTPAQDAELDKATTKDSNADKPDQKVLLLQSLLAIGALPEALFILGRYPWMMNLIPELPEYINRILNQSIDGAYESFKPLQSRHSLHNQQPMYDTDLPGLQKGQARLEERPSRRVLRWPLLDRNDSEIDGTSYRFYWDEWNDNIPQCQSVEDVFVLSRTLLPLVGAKIGQDPKLILKFARIGKASLREDSSASNKDRWLDLIKRALLPSLSLTKANPGVVNEVFELISTYDTQTRYQMYLEWSSGRTSRTPDMLSASKQAKFETKDVLKKISRTNVKLMARALARIAYANPHIVISTALPQIESYDSIADVFVEGTRYFTDLGYDVLTWALVESMAREGRTGIKADGMFTSRWLIALSHFVGKIYKRYTLIKPGPILQYVARQLTKGINTEMIMLEQLIVSMAGIAPDTNFNDQQLLAMGGGPLLQSQTVLQLLDQRHTSKATAKRLMKALEDHDLVSTMLVAIAQQRQACIFKAGDAPLKAIGYTFDEITRVLGQYLDMLKHNMPADKFQETIPSAGTLINKYEVPAEVAFWIGRTVIQKQINIFDRDNVKDTSSKDASGDVDMNDQDASEEDGEAIETDEVATTAATPTEQDITASVDEDMADAEEAVEGQWHPVLKGVMDEIQPQIASDIRDLVGAGFYVTFWQLSLYEINVPGKSYEDEMGRQKKKVKSIQQDRSNISTSAAKAKELQVKQLNHLVDELLAENKQHVKAYGESRARLQREKDQWFAAKSRVSTELNVALMEHCFLPRILLSPIDAYFCFKFAKMLHSFGTANFRTLGFYDLLMKPERLTSLFFMCTSKESDNIGKFLAEVLRDLGRWHKSKVTYEREAFGSKKNLPGFALKVENGKPQLLLDFEKFRGILFKWHCNLYSALVKCLGSSEYMHVRNAISILRAISTVWPVVDYHGRSLQKSVDKLGESEREDLKVASKALLGALHRRQKEWIQPQAFRAGPGMPQEQTSASTPEPAQALKSGGSVTDKKTQDVKMSDTPVKKPVDKAETGSTKDSERTPSATSGADRGKSPLRTSTPLPSRPPRESSLRPQRPESRPHDLPRRVSPPPRYPSSNKLPGRLEPDARNGYRESRPARPMPTDPAGPDSRTGYPRHISERPHEPSHDSVHRYPRSSDRPSMLDRDERLSRRDPVPRSDSRGGYEERRHNEREPRSEREPRPDREARHERETTRPSEREHTRPERSDRDHGRSTAEHSERKRDEGYTSSRRNEPSASRTAPAPTPAPAINPERAALIQGTDDSRPGMSIRGQAQDRTRSSHPTSPKRDEERKVPPRSDRDDRPERRGEPQVRTTQMPPSPAANRNTPAVAPSRETRGHGRSNVDITHGRLEQDSSHRPPPRQERGPDAEPPSGPPSGPRTRPSSSSLRTADPAPPPRPAPQQNRQPPSGPGGRHTRNSSFQEPQPAVSVPTDVGGIHPDRLNNIPPDGSRGTRPPPLQTSPPAGPRNGPPTGPSAPSPNTRGPPSGPQAEVQGGRGRRHPMAAVNNTLAQAAQGPNAPAGRGRGMRQNSISYPPASPVAGPNQGGFGGPPQQQDNPNGMPVQPRGPPNRQQDNMRGEEDRQSRSTRSHHQDQRDHDGSRGYHKDDASNVPPRREPRGPPHGRDDGGQQGGPPPRNGPRGYPRGPNPNGDENSGGPPQGRKHPRDESNSTPYGGGRGGRGGGEIKRARRGG